MPRSRPASNLHAVPAVGLEGVSLSLDGERLFDRLSVAFTEGRWTALLGVSGVGKTTILRLLAGLQQPDDGTVHCPGAVAYMAQQDLLLPWLNVLDNVTVGTRLRDGGRAARQCCDKALEILEKVGLVDRAGDKPATLSGGMRQRVALARTLMEDRPVVLMDEPFSALDAVTRHRLQRLTFDLLQDRTVILVTHDPLEALRLGHDIRVLQGGGTVTVTDPIRPDGNPPRRLEDEGVTALYPRLLSMLEAGS